MESPDVSGLFRCAPRVRPVRTAGAPSPRMIHRLRTGFVLGLAAALVAWGLARVPLARTVELVTYDARLSAVATGEGASPDIVLVTIGDDSLRRLEPVVGRWPWPRLVHASLLDFLTRGGARLVVYDVLFTERARGSFPLGDATWTGEESDQALVDAVSRAGMVILAAEASSPGLQDDSRSVREPRPDVPAFTTSWPVRGLAERRPVLTPPFPELARAARGIGHTFFAADPDGPWRRFVPFVDLDGQTVPSLPVAAALALSGTTPADVRVDVDALQLGRARVPLVRQVVPDYDGPSHEVRRGLVPFRGPTRRADGTPTFRSYSFYDLFYAEQQMLAGETPAIAPDTFRDRIVVVGVTASGLKDVFTVPFGEGAMPGAEVHANVLDGLLSGRSIAPSTPVAEVGLILAAALAVTLSGAVVTAAWPTALVTAAVGVLVVWGTTQALADGLALPLVAPGLALVLALLADLSWKYLVEGREKRRVKRLFSRYVSRDVYAQLMARPEGAVLGGQRRDMTVLFSDMRGFTTLAERDDPEALVRQLNEYFTRMVEVVFAHRGTIDKFVGDMVMALYGAPLDDPDHADHAVQTALAMIDALGDLNRQWAAEGRPTLDIGIGVSSGEMIAGNIGSSSIMSYTVIGDAVNLGARLESQTREAGARILISAATRARLKGRYDVRTIGAVTLKGKTQPVEVFEIRWSAPELGQDRP